MVKIYASEEFIRINAYITRNYNGESFFDNVMANYLPIFHNCFSSIFFLLCRSENCS